MRIFFPLLLLLLFLPSCFLGEKVGYNPEQPLEKQIIEQIKTVIENPPNSSKGWIYFLVGMGLSLGGAYVKYRFFPGSPGEKPALAAATAVKKNEVAKKEVPTKQPEETKPKEADKQLPAKQPEETKPKEADKPAENTNSKDAPPGQNIATTNNVANTPMPQEQQDTARLPMQTESQETPSQRATRLVLTGK